MTAFVAKILNDTPNISDESKRKHTEDVFKKFAMDVVDINRTVNAFSILPVAMDYELQSTAVNHSHVDTKDNPSSDTTEYVQTRCRRFLNDFVCENIFFDQNCISVLSASYQHYDNRFYSLLRKTVKKTTEYLKGATAQSFRNYCDVTNPNASEIYLHPDRKRPEQKQEYPPDAVCVGQWWPQVFDMGISRCYDL